MLFVGTGPDEELLKSSIQNLHLEHHCEMVGRIDDRQQLAEYFQLADLFLFPSLYDASSLVQIEAASQRTPSLFLRGAVTAQTVHDGIDGFLSDNSQVAYANKIISIFSDEANYQNVCEGAYQNLYRTWDDEILDSSFDYRRLIVIHSSRSPYRSVSSF
jgi:1,2-diacylglycerol 3-alpha-glucosyltransferase